VLLIDRGLLMGGPFPVQLLTLRLWKQPFRMIPFGLILTGFVNNAE
jgi:hypothetical protein